MKVSLRQWTGVAIGVAVVCGVLSLHRGTSAAPRGDQQPFGNSLEQRQEQVSQLKEICELLKAQNTLLREQNALLSSGRLQVVVTLPPKP